MSATPAAPAGQAPGFRGLGWQARLGIARAAAAFPRMVEPDSPPGWPELRRLTDLFPQFATAHLPLLLQEIALLHRRLPAGEGEALLGELGARFGLAAAEVRGAAALARSDAAAGLLLATQIERLVALGRARCHGLARLERPARGGLTHFFFLLFLGAILRRPDALRTYRETPRLLLDWFLVFGLSELGLWPLLGAEDRRAILLEREGGEPWFALAVQQFRPDLAELARRAGAPALRQWVRQHAAAEYRIAFPAPPPPPPCAPRLSVIAPSRYVLGLSDDCESICRALDAGAVAYEVVDMPPAPWVGRDPDKQEALRGRTVARPGGDRALMAHTLFEATGWALRHWEDFTGFRRVDLFSPWELPALPRCWHAALGLFDRLLVPTRFVQQAYAAAGASTAAPILPSIEQHARIRGSDRMRLRRAQGVPRGHRLVAVVFDFSSYLGRKNPAAAVAAFARLRRHGPPATLLVKTTRARRFPADLRRFRQALKGVAPVIWVDAEWSNRAVETLLAAADAYLSLHRAEGFGRNIAKALALGTPVVVTDYSGNRDLRDIPGYFGVRYALRPVGRQDYVGVEAQSWAEPDARDAVRQLAAALRPGRRGGAMARQALGRDRFARDLLRLLGLPPDPRAG